MTQFNLKKTTDLILGNFDFNANPINIFNEKIIEFLDEVSKEIFKNRKNHDYPDLISFGFWCRKKNLINISEDYKKKDFLIGRGCVLHIVPSNVPMNFSYSLSFGLLSGNVNIVRLPSRKFIQINILCEILKKILKKKKYSYIKKIICLMRYDKSEKISKELSNIVDARLIWGGDKTIAQFKKFPTSPRCIDLSFSNRYSISIVDIKKISKCNHDELVNLAGKFYNDSYLMDQQGCSSPQALFWIGKKNNFIQNKFWTILGSIVERKYKNDLSVTNKKIFALSDMAIMSNLQFKTKFKNFKLVKLSSKKNYKEIDKVQCHFGTFLEINVKNLDGIKNYVTKKYQTITYYGFDRKMIEKTIVRNGLKGIDRLVPFGRAFDMGPKWDGYDIIFSLSRIISN